LILLDDTPIFNPTHMFGLFSVIPPNTVNSLDLYKGNVPARFGGRVASVLDISTKNPNLEKLKLSGGISLVSSRLMVDAPIIKGKLGVYVAGRGLSMILFYPNSTSGSITSGPNSVNCRPSHSGGSMSGIRLR
jgi:hypothetical protein